MFSTGLDQRIRCWLVGEHGELTEHAHQIVSVPEPEALNARACGRSAEHLYDANFRFAGNPLL